MRRFHSHDSPATAMVVCRAVCRMNGIAAIAQLPEYRWWAQVPACPRQRGITIHVFGIYDSTRIDQKLNCFFCSKGRGTMKRRFSFVLQSRMKHSVSTSGFVEQFGLAPATKSTLRTRSYAGRFALHKAAWSGVSPVSGHAWFTSAPFSIKNWHSCSVDVGLPSVVPSNSARNEPSPT